MFEKKETAVTKKNSNLPAKIDFGIDPNEYSSGIDEADIKIPLMLLIHPQSKFPEFKQMAKEDRPEAGDFYNPVTQQRFPSGFKALVIHSFVQAYTQEKDPDNPNRKRIKRFSSDGKVWNDTQEPIEEWEFRWKDANGKERPEDEIAYKRFNYVILPEGTEDPCIIRFAKTSAKNARKMNYVLFRLKPMWRYWTEFTSAEESNANGEEYLVMQGQVQRGMPLEDQTLATLAYEMYQGYQNNVIETVGVEDHDDDDEVPNYSDDEAKQQ